MIKLNEYIIEKLKINKEVNKAEIPNNKEEFIDFIICNDVLGDVCPRIFQRQGGFYQFPCSYV